MMKTTRLFRWGRMVPLPHDRTHKQGWNHALEAMEDALRDDLAKGQLVSREDVIRRIRLLLDLTRHGERFLPAEEHYRRAGLNPDGSLPE
jgi:hypothetical protein